MSVDLVRLAKARKALELKKARKHAEHFVSFAFRNERDGTKLTNADFHCDWHEMLRVHRQVVLRAPVEHGKTQHLGIGKPLHLLGDDPNTRIAIISNTIDMASKLVLSLRQHIEENPRVREVFPALKQSSSPGDPWHTTALTVERDTISKDPSVQACGAYGAIVGSRLDVIILDDILDFENTRTPEQREKLIEWFETTVLTRATAGARIYVIGTPWHPEDLLHVLASREGFHSSVYSAVENPDDPPERWRPVWKAQWPLERLLERMRNTSEPVFLRKYLSRVRVDTAGRFRAAWIERMCELGRGRAFTDRAPKAQGNVRSLPCFTGVDLGVGSGIDSALTVIFTLAVMADGRLLICEVRSGRWTAPEIIDRLSDTQLRFGSQITVENNGAQRFLVQMAGERLKVQGAHTGMNKHDQEFGVESLAVEIRNGWWIMPSGSTGQDVPPEGRALISELLHYSPEAHTGDRVMAMWIARESARKYGAARTQRAPMQNR